MIADVRKRLSQMGSERYLIVLQILLAVLFLGTILFGSISAGAFPPKQPESRSDYFLFVGIVLWLVLGLVAGSAILLGRRCGWWVQFVVVLPLPVYAFFAWSDFHISQVESIGDYFNLFKSILFAFWYVYLPPWVFKRATGKG